MLAISGRVAPLMDGATGLSGLYRRTRPGVMALTAPPPCDGGERDILSRSVAIASSGKGDRGVAVLPELACAASTDRQRAIRSSDAPKRAAASASTASCPQSHGDWFGDWKTRNPWQHGVRPVGPCR